MTSDDVLTMPAKPTSKIDSDQAQEKCKLPDHKTMKYDRQLRLWGDEGQSLLESAHVCVINATALGTEILKNLILPGVGSFTLIDSVALSPKDMGNNFFMCPTSFTDGRHTRASIATKLLGELNPEVVGESCEDPLEKLLPDPHNYDPTSDLVQFWSRFSAIIYTGWAEDATSLNNLSLLAWKLNIPLLVVQCNGFLAEARLQVSEHCVIESHPDNALEDLRIERPFPELKEWLENEAKALDLSTDRNFLSHVPCIVILYKYLHEWRSKFNKPNLFPQNYSEKKILRGLIESGLSETQERCHIVDKEKEDSTYREVEWENWKEASQAVNNLLITGDHVPESVRVIFNTCKSDTSELSYNQDHPNFKFWLMVRGLKTFVDTNHCLPVRGSLPDMTSDSARFITLQNIYREKAAHDADEVYGHIMELINKNSNEMKESSNNCNASTLVSREEVRRFCRNARDIRILRTDRIVSSETNGEPRSPDMHRLIRWLLYDSTGCESDQREDGEDTPETGFIVHVLFQAVERFVIHFKRLPGDTKSDDLESDVKQLKGLFKEVISEHAASISPSLSSVGSRLDDNIHEMCRYGGAELHSVASFMGGCMAQEVIKLLTHQFVPFNNTFIYNALKSTTVSFQL